MVTMPQNDRFIQKFNSFVRELAWPWIVFSILDYFYTFKDINAFGFRIFFSVVSGLLFGLVWLFGFNMVFKYLDRFDWFQRMRKR